MQPLKKSNFTLSSQMRKTKFFTQKETACSFVFFWCFCCTKQTKKQANKSKGLFDYAVEWSVSK